MRNRLLFLVSVFILMSGLIVACPKPAPQIPVEPAPKPVLIDPFYYGGCILGGASYMVAHAAGAVISRELGIRVVVESTGCGVDNVKLVQRGDTHAGLSGIASPYRAYRGIEPYKFPHENLRGWYPYYPVVSHVLVLKDSPITTIEDLKGKRVNVHIKGSGAEEIARDWLHAIGLGYDVIKPFFLSYKAATEAIKAGAIDATVWTTGVPVPEMLELGVTHPYRMIEVPEKLIREKVMPVLPIYAPILVDAKTAYGAAHVGPPHVVQVGAYTIAFLHKDVPEEMAYRMTKAIWANRAFMAAWHPTCAEMCYTMVRAMEVALPWHPGAKRFYEEVGVWTDKPSPLVLPLKPSPVRILE